jgi:glycine/D-amino acid oxidase-like deaminating enzyme
MLSFWELDSFRFADLAVIGAGITGLSVAVSYKEKYPNRRVIVIERDLIPTGASTRNAGFACFGSLTEIADDLRKYGSEATVNLVASRWEGLQILRQRLGDAAIEYQPDGGFDLLFEEQLAQLANIDPINDLLRPVFRQDVFREEPDLITRFGFKGGVKTIVSNRLEGQLNTGKMMVNLRHLAGKLGVELYTGAEVSELDIDDNRFVKVNFTKYPQTSFLARQVVLSNGFHAKALIAPFAEYHVIPARNQVLITAPLSHVPFRGSFHFDEGFYYFRNVGNRVLFGGGRNLDLETETTAEHGINTFITDQLEGYLRDVILPQTEFLIESHWTGIFDMGTTKQPFLDWVAERVFVASRLGGMGVALGSLVGKQTVARLAERE